MVVSAHFSVTSLLKTRKEDPKISIYYCQKTGYPVANQDWQFVHYKPGQQYKAHLGRMYTMFIYLNTAAEGGETGFPVLDRKFKALLEDRRFMTAWTQSTCSGNSKLNALSSFK